MRIGKWLIQLIKWSAALGLSFLLVNGLIFFYYNRPAWITRENGATDGIYHPGKTIFYAYEGLGILETDENGYVNPSLPLADQYVLVLGSSHTQGKEVMMEERYTSVLNGKIGEEGTLSVYNMGIDGNYYPAIVSHFEAALQEFPNAAAVVIEIGSTDYSAAELENALQPVEYDPMSTGTEIMNHLSLRDNAEIAVKEALPLAILLSYRQLSDVDLGSGNPFWADAGENIAEEDENAGGKEETELLEESMEYLVSVFSGPLFILYHPSTALEEDGSMKIVRDGGVDGFRAACEKQGIFFIDM